MMNIRLKEMYRNEVRPAMMTSREYANLHEAPRLEKIVVNMGVSCQLGKDALDEAIKDLTKITGRKPAINIAKKSVSNFKLREGQSIGCRVTLRRDTMYEFLDRLISAALPRIRDFRGIPVKSFDGRGNYSLGLNDQTIFPEIDLDKIKRTQGMDVTFVTTARTDEEAKELLKRMGMPFADSQKS